MVIARWYSAAARGSSKRRTASSPAAMYADSAPVELAGGLGVVSDDGQRQRRALASRGWRARARALGRGVQASATWATRRAE